MPSSPAMDVHTLLRDREDAATSSGSSNPPESRTTGTVFGQSPSPQVLLSRRSSSASKAKPSTMLPSFSEVWSISVSAWKLCNVAFFL